MANKAGPVLAAGTTGHDEEFLSLPREAGLSVDTSRKPRRRVSPGHSMASTGHS